MTSIKQKIPGYVAGGMTDQPDELKAPGQLREMTNAFPDVTLNLMKRPGFQWVTNLQDAQPEGKWFNITAESPFGYEEQYIVNIHKNSGSVYIWAADDVKGENGNVIANKGTRWTPGFRTDPIPLTTDSSFQIIDTVDDPVNSFDYFKHSGEADLQVLNIGATTLITNRKVTPTMTTSSPGGEERPHEAFVDLRQVAYNRQYSLNITGPTGYRQSYRTATRISVRGTDMNASDGSCYATGSQTYNDLTTTDGATEAKNLRVRITVTGQSVPNPDNENDYNCSYRIDSDLLYGGEGWRRGLSIGGLTMDTVTPPSGRDTPNYRITVEEDELIVVEDAIALIRPEPTPSSADQVLKAETILADLKNELDDTGFFSEVTIIGNGIYLKADTPFSVSTPEMQLFNILSSTEDETTRKVIDSSGGTTISTYGVSLTTINNTALLPLECRHNYLVKVSNSLSEDDDYYLQFKGGNNSDGEGVWEEVWRPGIRTTLNPQTMPQQIRRVWTGNSIDFVIAPIDWVPRNCGDDKTNPVPSFVSDPENGLYNPTINNMLLYRNRLVMLTGSKVVLSQAGQLGNFFKETALISSPVDPIDIECSVDTSTMLYDGLVVNNGMVLFSRYHQFMFTTDSDVLKADTAKCTLLASYDFNTLSNPFNMASNIGFFSSTNNDSIFWEMKDIFREGPPTVTERSKPLSKTLPGNLNLLCASREDGLILASKKGSSDIWGYRFYSEGNRDIQRAWFKWTIPGEMIYHFNNTRGKYWIAFEDGNDYRLMSFNTDGFEQFKYLDNWYITRPGGLTGDGRTAFGIPYTPDNKPLMIYAFGSGRTAELTSSGSTVYADGDWMDEGDVLVGYPFEMRLEFPHIYVFQQENNSFRSDTDSSLTIHRLKFNFNAVGYYQLLINRYGKDDYIIDIELPQADDYNLNTPALKREEQFTVPIYERNTSFDYILTSSNPTPNVLLSMTYEGDYTDNYYKRV